MRVSPRGRTAFLLLYGALLAWQIDRWCFTPHGLASTWSSRHDGRVASAAAPGGLSQSFTMGADGLDGVWLRPRLIPGTPQGDLIVDLLAVQGGTAVRVERVALPAARVAHDGDVHVPFRMVRASRGHAYRLDIRHVNPGDGPGIGLAVSRDDALPGGRFLAYGAEQWGDLVFETASRRATLPYWMHEVLRPWPSWVRSWPAIVLGLLAFNLVLAWACGVATGFVPPAETAEAPEAAGEEPPSVGRLASAVAVGIAVVGIVLVARPTGRYRALDLIAALPEASIESTWGTLHGGISPGPVLFGSRVHRGIVAMPPSTITWTVVVPRDAVLRLGAGMRQDMWEQQSDGIQMRVAVEHGTGRTVAADLTLFPLGVPEHRKLFPIEVPLHAWAGQQVRIVLQSTPERFGNAVNDVPVWTEPRIEWPRTPGAGVARVVKAGS